MLADLNLSLEFTTITALIGGAIGLLYGILAERSKFCLRRALAGVDIDRQGAFSVWICGFATALLGTQLLVSLGMIDFAEHRLMNANIPWFAAIFGGLIFGAGMILTRGCISRLTVLSGTGNLRALSLIIVFALIANATIKGILAPLRVLINRPVIELQSALIPFGWVVVFIVLILAAIQIRRVPLFPSRIVMGGLLGLLVPLSWYCVIVLLKNDFDPIPFEGLSLTLPHADLNFWMIAATSIPVNFGIGFVLGVMMGAFFSAISAKRFEWQSFSSPRQTGRYFLGAVMMGFGGVLAGGCSVGVGLSGASMLSITAFLALGSIMIAGYVFGKLYP